jgi:hypothetical protein
LKKPKEIDLVKKEKVVRAKNEANKKITEFSANSNSVSSNSQIEIDGASSVEINKNSKF